MATRIVGFILMMLGLLFCLTIIGAVFGIPMIIVGSILVVISLFGRQKTTITNVVHVSSGPYPGVPTPPSSPAQPVIAPEPARPLIEPAARLPRQVSTAKFCSGCGAAVIEVESAFCAQCGAKL